MRMLVVVACGEVDGVHEDVDDHVGGAVVQLQGFERMLGVQDGKVEVVPCVDR
jgi:hypothetical protein